MTLIQLKILRSVVVYEKMIISEAVGLHPISDIFTTLKIQLQFFWVMTPFGRIPMFRRSMLPPSSWWSTCPISR